MTDNKAVLDEFARSLNAAQRMLVGREVSELPKRLVDGEQLLGLVPGVYESRNGLLVCTDRRLMFFEKGLMRERVEDFFFDKISSVQHSTGLMLGEITIFASGNKATIKSIEKSRTQPFADLAKSRVGSAAKPQATAGSIGDLEKLADMHRSGLLTAEEFTAAKKKLLGM